MEEKILISVIIPVKNGDSWLEQLLKQLMKQTLINQSEIIFIDSGSTDRSLEMMASFPVKVLKISPNSFNHGDTRNFGVNQSLGKYIVMTVQDAVPSSDAWLENLIKRFEDENIAGVCGQQIVPHDLDKNPILWFRPVSQPTDTRHSPISTSDYEKMSPEDRRQLCTWDNVNAAYRRDILLQFPFPRTDFAEDISWAKNILLKGYSLIHTGDAKVYHYHHQTPEFVLPRYFSVFYYEYQLFQLVPKTKKSFAQFVFSTAKLLMRESVVSWKDKIKWFVFNLRYRMALQKTIRLFNHALSKGQQFLDQKYTEVCQKIPQAPKYSE